MDFYKILNLEKTCTNSDIKKAYRNLIVIYHPDKNKDENANQKFNDIQMAYELLRDEKKRKEYDTMNEIDKIELYTSFKDYITRIFPYYKEWINLFYDKEDDFKNDINTLNLVNMFDRFNNKISDVIKDVKLTNLELDINCEIKTSLLNRYLNKYAKVGINRNLENDNLKSKFFYVPLRDDMTIYPKEGITNSFGFTGDLIVNVVCENDTNFKILNNYDLSITLTISLYSYLYGGFISFEHIDSSNIDINFNSMINSIPIISLENHGLVKSVNGTTVDRGNLYVRLVINNVNDDEFKNKILDLQ